MSDKFISDSDTKVMAGEIKVSFNQIERNLSMRKEEDDILEKFSKDVARVVHQYHQTLPNYQPTPLIHLKHLADKIKVRNVWVKDESKRFNLNAFKVLGASFAFAKYILGAKADLTFDNVLSKVDKVSYLVTLICTKVDKRLING